MHSSSALLLVVQAVVLMLTTQPSTAQVNYTCLASAAISTSSSQAAAVGSCLNNANGALTATSIKACIKSTKTKDKTAKKPQALFYKCLNAYWKAVTALAKTNSSISAAATSCLASTGSYDSCKLATIVGTSNAKLAKKATKADAKWTGKKCAGILTPAGCSVVSAASTTTSTTNGSSTTTTLTTTTTATTPATTATPATTTTTTAATTTTPDPCLTEYCQTQCILSTCNEAVTTLAEESWSNNIQLTCSSNMSQPDISTLQGGTIEISFQLDTFCGSRFFFTINDPSASKSEPMGAGPANMALRCTPGTGAQSWAAGVYGNYTKFYCLN